MTSKPPTSLTWVIPEHPQRLEMEYAIRLLCTLMGTRALFGHSPDNDAMTVPTLHYGLPASERSPLLQIRMDEHFWSRVGSGSDITPIGAAEWHGVMYPRWGESGDSRKSRLDEWRVCPVDPVAATFFIVSRIEELRNPIVDRHGRFPAAQSWMVRMGLIERALVNHYASSILEIVSGARTDDPPNPWPRGANYAIAFTHDIDRLRMHESLWRDVRSGVGGLRFRGGVGAAIRRSRSLFGSRILGKRDPYDTFEYICDNHERRRIKPTWFWIATKPSIQNADYHPSDTLAATCISRLQSLGHEIGLHGSYASLDSPDVLVEEKRTLEAVTNQPVESIRQHYLRFRVDHTWNAQEGAHLTADSTLGFAECFGFRAGIAAPFHPWDFTHRREHKIWEVPMVMMDGTAREYMGLAPNETIARSNVILDELQRVRGATAVLWHNSSLNDVDWNDWQTVYESWLQFASGGSAWCDTLSSIVNRWQSHLRNLNLES